MMAIDLFFTLLLTLPHVLSGSQWCPSSAYTLCADQGTKLCYISDTVKEGYISFGANGRWILRPFTNDGTNGRDFAVRCEHDHGGDDVAWGQQKGCCYIAVDTGANALGWRKQQSSGTAYPWSAYPQKTITMRRGLHNAWIYRVFNGVDVSCSDPLFADAARGEAKVCEEAPSALPGIPERDSNLWTLCGNGGHQCTGLDTSGLNWVRYGDNGKYYFRLIVSQHGDVSCHESVFGDPLHGQMKYCWRAKPLISVQEMMGSWVELQRCHGCGEHTYKKTLGVTELTENEVTKTFAWEVSVSMTKNFGLKAAGASGSVTVTASVGGSTANRMKTQFSKTATEESTFTCNNDVLYQWTVSGKLIDVGTKYFGVKGDQFVCVSQGTVPFCAPGYCSDDNCMEPCTPAMTQSALPAMPIMPQYQYRYPYDAPPAVYLPQSYVEWLFAFAVLIVLCLAMNLFVTIVTKCADFARDRSPSSAQYAAVKNVDVDFEYDRDEENGQKVV